MPEAEDRKIAGLEQTGSDAEQSSADVDQILSDSDQTGSEHDQISSDRDQAAADIDQAATEGEHLERDELAYERTRRMRADSTLERHTASRARASPTALGGGGGCPAGGPPATGSPSNATAWRPRAT
jgi:outer membrane murein-binding lipoprotein Lpp